MQEGHAGRALISYAHGRVAHEADVDRLCALLRANGVDAHTDRTAAEQPQDWAQWTTDAIRDARWVLMIVSADYRRRFEDDAPAETGRGVRWEARHIRDALYADQRGARLKFLTVLLPDGRTDDIPAALQPATGTHYRVREFTRAGAEKLIRLLTGQPAHVEHELRPAPSLPPVTAVRVVLRLDVTGGSAEDRDAVTRALLGSGRPRALPVDAVTVGPDGASVVLDAATAAEVVEPCLRRLHACLPSSTGPVPELRVGLGADVVDTASTRPAGEVAGRLARCAVTRALLDIPDVHLVVAVSAAFRAWSSDAASFPVPGSYRQEPADGAAGEVGWFGVPGRNPCPRPARPAGDRGHAAAPSPGYWFPNAQGDVTIVTQGDHGHVQIGRDRGER